MGSTAHKTYSAVLILLFVAAGCSPRPEKSAASYVYNRVISPLPFRHQVDEKYKVQAEQLNARYYYLLGEYLTRKKDIKGALQALERARSFNEGEPEIYYSLSGIYAQLGKVEEAEALLRRTLELDPKHFTALLDLAQLIKNGESMSEVRELFGRAAKINPDSDEAVLGLVVLDMAGRDYAKARKSLTEFLKRRADSHLGYFYLATLEQDQGNVRLAEKHYQKSLEIRPDFARAAAYLGQIYESQNRSDDALKLFEDSAQYVQGASFYKRIGELQAARKAPAKAREAYEAYLEVDRDNAEVMLRLAFLALETKDLTTAEKYFKKVTELKPEFSSAHYFIGLLFEEKKEYDAALAAFKKVKSGTAVSADAIKAQSRIYGSLKKYDEGWKLLDQAYSELSPETSSAEREKLVVEMISFLSRAKKHGEAIAKAEKYLKEFPRSEELHYARAAAREDNGDALAAAKELEAFIKSSNTKHAGILNFVGYVFADNDHELVKAEAYVRAALKLRPEDPYIADSLGWVLFKRGDFRKAETWLRRAMAGAADEAVILEHLADCLVKLGALQEATELYAKAVGKESKKSGDRERLQAKFDSLQQKLRAICSADASDASCRVVRDPRSPATSSNQNP